MGKEKSATAKGWTYLAAVAGNLVPFVPVFAVLAGKIGNATAALAVGGVRMKGGMVRGVGELRQRGIGDVRAVVEVLQIAVLVNQKRVAGILCVQPEGFGLLVIKNWHMVSSFLGLMIGYYHFIISAGFLQDILSEKFRNCFFLLTII